MKQEEIAKIIGKITMNPSRKGEIKRILLAKVDERVRVAELNRRTVQNTTTRNALFRRISTATMALMLFIAIGAGTSLAANKSLPGDKLYPIKVNVNEKVAGLFVVSDKSKLDWEAHLAEERLKEADKLKEENRLTGRVKENLKKDFEDQVDKVQQAAQQIGRRSGPSDLKSETSKLEERFRGRKAIIKELGSEDPILKIDRDRGGKSEDDRNTDKNNGNRSDRNREDPGQSGRGGNERRGGDSSGGSGKSED